MSSENHVPRIGKREIRGAAIGAGAGAILGIIIASGTSFAQPFDAVVLILKWTVVWMIAGATFSWSIWLEIDREKVSFGRSGWKLTTRKSLLASVAGN